MAGSLLVALLVALLLTSATLGQPLLVAAKSNIAASQADGLAALQMAWGELEPTWAVGSDCSKALGLSCDDQGRIVAINMPPGNISGYLPEGISALKSLQQISLPSNQLFSTLPLSVSLLTNLTSIELPNNNITGSIPTSWFQLRDLEFLDLSRNRLTSSLPDAFDSLFSLQLLNLSSNSFSGTLPPSIGYLNFLEKLDLHSNPFSGSLPAALAQLSSLTLLDIAATGLLCPLQGTCPSHTVSMSSLYCEFCSSFCRYCNDPSEWFEGMGAVLRDGKCVRLVRYTCITMDGTCPSSTISMSSLYCEFYSSFCRYCNNPSEWCGEEGELV
ncbi:unnamed protein product [Closterium sp. NIES-53]